MTMPRKPSKHYEVTEARQKLGVEDRFIYHCIECQWIIPAEPDSPRLDDEDLARLQLIRELEQDLGVNEEAVPIILHLLDQIHLLRSRIMKSA